MFSENCIFFAEECGIDLPAGEGYLLRSVRIEREDHGYPTLVFASEAENPGSFFIDGQVRIAKTASTAGSEIVINTDLIITQDIVGGYTPFTLSQATAILVHELGHHYDDIARQYNLPRNVITSHEHLDIVGAKVGQFIEHRTQRAFVGGEVHPALENAEISFENFVQESGQGDGDYHYGSLSKTFLKGPFGYIDITQDLARRSRCPDLVIDGVRESGSPINLFFENYEKHFASLSNNRINLQLGIIGRSHMNCILPSNSFHSFAGYTNGIINIYFDINQNTITFAPNTNINLSIAVPPDEDWWQ